MKISDIHPHTAILAVFLEHIRDGDFAYLTGVDFIGADPDDVRIDLSEAVEHVLWSYGLESNAENAGEATDIILDVLPSLSKYLEETTDRE
ncbi:MAG TPA: hypothetical protein PKZ27_02955 [Rhodocyclaceae bacterium]|nr:hypothetical protein [Burkholderiaceae bacterium]HRP74525.1 hypothetical protein [Rhodocyclaceae bacterium]